MTEIAFAAGFGSLRQFNRACRDVFRDSPRNLRARRRKTDRLVADGGLPLRLSFLGDLDWPALLDYFAAQAIPGVECVEGGVYRRTIVVDDYPGVLEFRLGGEDHLVVCAHLPRWGELVHIVQRARALAGLDLCLEEPQRALAAEPLLAPLLRRRPGLRPPGTWDAFETGVLTILGRHATARVVQRFGERVAGLERLGLTHTFPSPATLAAADLDSPQAAVVHAFARAVADGAIRLDRSVGLGTLVESLISRGIEASAAEYVALRLGELDAFPARGIPAAHAERWRPWRALAATHLWFADDDRLRGVA